MTQEFEAEGAGAADLGGTGWALLGGAGCVVLGAASVFWIGCGLTGIKLAYGSGWALFAGFLAFGLRFALPLVWGTFLFARIVWDWPVVGAVLFAAPGLLLLIPVIVASLFDALRGALRSR
jgi:hypothetical protein